MSFLIISCVYALLFLLIPSQAMSFVSINNELYFPKCSILRKGPKFKERLIQKKKLKEVSCTKPVKRGHL